jgi:hypothetical protein
VASLFSMTINATCDDDEVGRSDAGATASGLPGSDPPHAAIDRTAAPTAAIHRGCEVRTPQSCPTTPSRAGHDLQREVAGGHGPRPRRRPSAPRPCQRCYSRARSCTSHGWLTVERRGRIPDAGLAVVQRLVGCEHRPVEVGHGHRATRRLALVALGPARLCGREDPGDTWAASAGLAIPMTWRPRHAARQGLPRARVGLRPQVGEHESVTANGLSRSCCGR